MPSNFDKVSKSAREFVIPFIGLKLGSHEFSYEIGTEFFENIDFSIIHQGMVHVTLVLDKKETMLIGDFSVEGSVTTDCDRCTDPVEVKVTGAYRLIFKFGTEISDDEMLIVMPPDTYEIDMQPHIYELITVSLPSRTIHKPGECNEDMIQRLGEYLVNQEDDEDEEEFDFEDEDWEDDQEDEEEDGDSDDGEPPIDPRWSILKDLN